jgi:hypothetical protein
MLPERLTDFLRSMSGICRSQFPRRCRVCGRTFEDFAAYVRGTVPVGAPLPDDVEDDDPIGLLSFANRSCGNTLALRCEVHDGATHRDFNRVLHEEAARAGRPVADVLRELRDELRGAAQR